MERELKSLQKGSQNPENGTKKPGRMTGTNENASQLNAFLDRLVAKIYAYQNELLQNNIPLTAEAIKNKFTGKLNPGC